MRTAGRRNEDKCFAHTPNGKVFAENPNAKFSKEDCAMVVHYSETCLCWPPFVLFKVAQLIRAANLGKQLDTMKIELCTITCASVHFRVHRQAVVLESRYILYITLSVITNLQYNNGLSASRIFQYVVHAGGGSV